MADFKVTQLGADLDFEHLPYWLNETRLMHHKIALIGEKLARAASRARQGG